MLLHSSRQLHEIASQVYMAFLSHKFQTNTEDTGGTVKPIDWLRFLHLQARSVVETPLLQPGYHDMLSSLLSSLSRLLFWYCTPLDPVDLSALEASSLVEE